MITNFKKLHDERSDFPISPPKFKKLLKKVTLSGYVSIFLF